MKSPEEGGSLPEEEPEEEGSQPVGERARLPALAPGA
jgi:hypothetical protein